MKNHWAMDSDYCVPVAGDAPPPAPLPVQSLLYEELYWKGKSVALCIADGALVGSVVSGLLVVVVVYMLGFHTGAQFDGTAVLLYYGVVSIAVFVGVALFTATWLPGGEPLLTPSSARAWGWVAAVIALAGQGCVVAFLTTLMHCSGATLAASLLATGVAALHLFVHASTAQWCDTALVYTMATQLDAQRGVRTLQELAIPDGDARGGARDTPPKKTK